MPHAAKRSLQNEIDLLEALPVLVLSFDDERVCRSANAASRRLMAPLDPVGVNLQTLLARWPLSRHAEPLDHDGIEHFIHPDGRIFRCSTTMLAPDSICLTLLDIGDRTGLSNLLRLSGADHEEAETNRRTNSRLLGGMSHELRTPLHGIIGCARMLRLEGDLNSVQDGRVNAMLAAGQTLLDLINTMLDLPDIEDSDSLPPQEEYAPPDRPLRALVVDDIEMNCEIASAFLRSVGHEVVCADGGIEAVIAARAADFDVVLMDICMPDVDGLEATRRIRAIEGRRGQVPIVALTAQALIPRLAEFENAGMDGHLVKPYAPETLIAVAEKAAKAGRSGQ